MPSALPTGMPAERLLPRLLLALLMALLFYLPNQAQIPLETGVRGLNVPNVLFLLALGATLMIKHERAERVALKLPLLLFVLVLTWSLAVALLRDASAWVADLTVFKNAVFYPLLYVLYFHAVRDMKSVRVLLLLTLFVVFTSGVLGLRQALDYGLANFSEYKRVAAPFGWGISDANRAAVFFCIQLQFVAAAALFLRSRPLVRLACAGIFLLGVFVVFQTYSRQAYGILAATLLLITLRKHLVLAFVAVVALYNYTLWVPETVVQRIEMTTLDPYGAGRTGSAAAAFDPLVALDRPAVAHLPRAATAAKGDASEGASAAGDEPRYDGSTESRFALWGGAWEVIQRHPMGIGINRFKREVAPYVPEDLRDLDAHNYYVLLATEAGVVAPLFLVALLGALLLLGQRLARVSEDDEAHALGVGFVMATLAVVMGNLYGSRFVDGDVMGNYWIVAALVARTVLIKERERLERQKPVRGSAAPARAGSARTDSMTSGAGAATSSGRPVRRAP